MRIVGIDPGYAITGVGVIDYIGNHFQLLECQAITTDVNEPMERRLLCIAQKLEMLVETYKPDVFAVEELFFNTNTKTAIAVGQGRGVVLLTAARYGIPVAEYTPLQVKQAVTGYGRADKAQMQQMVKVILQLSKVPKPDDIADALAVSICHAHSANLGSLAYLKG